MPDIKLYNMQQLMEIFGNVSRDTIDRKFAEGRIRKIKQGSYTYARSDDVETEIERLTSEAEEHVVKRNSKAA